MIFVYIFNFVQATYVRIVKHTVLRLQSVYSTSNNTYCSPTTLVTSNVQQIRIPPTLYLYFTSEVL